MSEAVCAQCGHGPHLGKKCHFTNCLCQNFIRFEVAIPQLLISLNNQIGRLSSVVGTIVDIINELYPDAVKSVQDKYNAAIEQAQAAQAAQQALAEGGSEDASDSTPADNDAGAN